MSKESDLLDWIRRRAGRSRNVPISIGDDAALVRTGRRTILKVDAVVEGVHFRDASLAQIGHKAVARPLSDIAAVGGIPKYALVAFGLPKGFGLERAKRLYRAVERTACRYRVDIVGGDVVLHRGPLSVTVTISAEPGPAGFVGRSGARPGDRLFVTGPLGGSILGKHLRFRPRLKEGRRLARRAHAMIDISDGFLIDLARLCEASGVGARIDLSRLPVAPAARRLSERTGRSPLRHALEDGEDYELLYAAPGRGGVGVMTRERGIVLDPPVDIRGWDPLL